MFDAGECLVVHHSAQRIAVFGKKDAAGKGDLRNQSGRVPARR
jgi:hypothetical protein